MRKISRTTLDKIVHWISEGKDNFFIKSKTGLDEDTIEEIRRGEVPTSVEVIPY